MIFLHWLKPVVFVNIFILCTMVSFLAVSPCPSTAWTEIATKMLIFQSSLKRSWTCLQCVQRTKSWFWNIHKSNQHPHTCQKNHHLTAFQNRKALIQIEISNELQLILQPDHFLLTLWQHIWGKKNLLFLLCSANLQLWHFSCGRCYMGCLLLPKRKYSNLKRLVVLADHKVK